MDWKDILERAGWTFVEATLGIVTVASIVDVDTATWKLAAASGLAAALSLLKSVAKQRLDRPS
jgi:hypothetical protein